ncbi:MAG: sodium:calcium antiporter, partial [Nanoarchaeota archaeon]
MMIADLLVFFITLAILIKSSDYFIDYVKKIAEILNISDFIIGFTLVAVGTSLPELVSSIGASYYKSSGLIMGNIVGSNKANILIILAVAAL